jgi:transglutaminase-like putative cysteine protease
MLDRTLGLAAIAVVSLAQLLQPVSAQAQTTPNERHFVFQYAFTVKDVPAGEPLHVWIPLAHADAYQRVKVLSETGDLQLRKTEDEFGNTMLYAEAAKAEHRDYKFTVEYDAVRFERIDLVNGKLAPGVHPDKVPKAVQVRYLQPDRLVPTSGVPAELAAQETRNAKTQLEKARDIYDYVFRTMRYDKSGTGWGHGDTLWACDSKRGNCTDFHSVFMSMARSQHIPVRFSIGFPLPADKHAGEIPGYHCWAEFYVDQMGWIPVDISEAWKHPERKDYFFGAHDQNRIQFTTGRDLKLNPPQAGPPLNYFVYPYVEVAGKEYPNVSDDFSFHDEGSPVTGTSASK